MSFGWIEANGIAIRHARDGPPGAPLLVLIHEMGGMLESWDGVVSDLMADRRILRYDLRGAGLSEKPPGPIAIDDLADDLAALLGQLAIKGPVAVAGCAVGAAVAIRFATRHPHRMDRLILLSPATFLPSERRDGMLRRADELETQGLRQNLKATSGEDDKRRLRGLGNAPHGVAALMRMLVDLDLAPDLARIACPTLVVAGRDDTARPPDLVRSVAAAIPGAVFRELPTGHVMALDSPGLVAEIISTFLSAADRR